MRRDIFILRVIEFKSRAHPFFKGKILDTKKQKQILMAVQEWEGGGGKKKIFFYFFLFF